MNIYEQVSHGSKNCNNREQRSATKAEMILGFRTAMGDQPALRTAADVAQTALQSWTVGV